VIPARDGVDYFLRQRFGEPLDAILGLCWAMLLMAGVDLTTLLLVRSLSRFHEIGIRLALGARGRALRVFLHGECDAARGRNSDWDTSSVRKK
jgi:hypothetical protein